MMERYREYKESGVKWLGEIPSHWEVVPLRKYLKINTRRNMPEAQLLSVTREEGVIVRNVESKEENHNYIPDDLSNYKYVQRGQFVINKMKSWQGSYGVSNYDGIVSPAYFVYDLNYPNKDYFNIAIRSKIFSPFFSKYSKGIRVDQWDLTPEALKIIPFLEPPKAEQDAIVRYLDSATSEIDKAIAMQQKMIDLLNERKQIVIQNAVTKGLDENVEMKESGVEWIGRIPKHWEVVRLSHLTSKIGSGSTPKAGYVESGIIFLRSQNVYCEGLKLNDVVHISANVHRNMSGTKVLPNDVLMNITGGSIGRCFYVDETLGEANVNQHVSIIRPTSIDTHYLKYYLQSYCGQIQVSLEQTGGNREGLTAKALAKFLITYPSQSEQKEIAAYLDSEMQRFDSAITNCQRQITLLQERKQIIINEVVTGKVRVI